jgi:hypothetical protein
MAPARPANRVAVRRCRSKRLSASELPTSTNVASATLATRNVPGGTAASSASQRLMPSSTFDRTRTKPSAALMAVTRPTANATRESLPGCITARPKIARPKAPKGLSVGKPEPQLDSTGGPAHKPVSDATAIVTAAKPAA